MVEFIAGLVTGYVLTWPALLGIVVLALLCEHGEANGWAVFFGLVAMVVAYFTVNVPLTTLLMIAGGYSAIGLVFSFWRYKRFVSAEAKDYIAYYKNSDSLEAALDKLKASKNLGKITSWFVIWPISLIENITGDIINAIQTLITDTFHKIYENIWNSSTSEAQRVIVERRKAEEEHKKVDVATKATKYTGPIIVGDKDISK